MCVCVCVYTDMMEICFIIYIYTPYVYICVCVCVYIHIFINYRPGGGKKKSLKSVSYKRFYEENPRISEEKQSYVA